MIHRFYITFFIAFFLVSCSTSNKDGIFREISIWPYGKIALGEEFEQKDDISVEVTPHMYELVEYSFGGAESLIVFTDSLNQVKSMRFQYSDDYDFHQEVINYKSSLGESAQSINSDTLDLVIWRNDKTTFELGREKNGTHIINYSILKDNR